MSNTRIPVVSKPVGMSEAGIFEHLVLAGGPARSGTTLLARMLSLHPQLALARDNRVYESWGLYRYADYSGLVDELRRGRLQGEEARQYLLRHITQDGRVTGIAPSPSLQDNPRAIPGKTDTGIVSFALPLEDFGPDLRLCLKSPEICFVLPELADLFPNACFTLVYRPVLEIAESMYRKGNEWPNAYQRRWNRERDSNGVLVAPPDTPEQLAPYWSRVTDFQRCVIRATAFLRAMLEGSRQLPAERVFLYYLPHMRQNPTSVLEALAAFLGIHPGGFLPAEQLVRQKQPAASAELLREFEEISPLLDLQQLTAMADKLCIQYR